MNMETAILIFYLIFFVLIVTPMYLSIKKGKKENK